MAAMPMVIDIFATRRALLRGTGLTALLWLLPRVGRAEELSAWEGLPWEVALGVGSALAAGLGEPFPALEDTAYREHLRAFLLRLPPSMARDLRLLLRLVEFGPPLIIGRFRRFSRMTPAERAAYLAAWPDHRWRPIRMAATALKLVFAPLYAADPAVWPALGYEGPWVGRIPVSYYELPPQVEDRPLDELLP